MPLIFFGSFRYPGTFMGIRRQERWMDRQEKRRLRKEPDMSKAKKGDTVKVHYTGTLDDESIFDSSRERSPMEFTIGAGNLIEGFEKGVLGMTIGETRTVKIPPEEGYGNRDENLITQIDRTYLPQSVEPAIGQQLQVKQPDGKTFVVWITDLDDQTVTIDANHPLAGENLNFEIELTEIVE
jgi:FKBP-type peptidyl-prolyl cis-trans isomerase 2